KARASLDKVKFATTEEAFSHVKDPTSWHWMTIIARGNTFVHILDGRVMSGAVEQDAQNSRKSGLLGLAVHQGPALTSGGRNCRATFSLKRWAHLPPAFCCGPYSRRTKSLAPACRLVRPRRVSFSK